MTKNEFYKTLQKFADGYGDNKITIDRGHARVLLENKNASLEALTTSRDQNEKLQLKILALLKTQESDQAIVNSLESELEIANYKLVMSERSRDNAVADGIKALRACPRKIESIEGYDSK